MTPQRACFLHGLDIVRAYAPHLLRNFQLVPRLVVSAPEPVEPKPEPPPKDVTEGLVAPRHVKVAIRRICDKHNVTYEQLCSPSREPRLAAIRTEIYVYLRAMGWSLSQIGKLMCRDHTSVVHALQKVARS